MPKSHAGTLKAVRAAPKRRTRKCTPTVTIVIVPRGAPLKNPPMIARPDKLFSFPPLTRNPTEARTYADRKGPWKFLNDHPHLRRRYEARKIAVSP